MNFIITYIESYIRKLHVEKKFVVLAWGIQELKERVGNHFCFLDYQ